MSKAAVRDYFTHDAEPYRRAYDDDTTRGVIFRERRRIVLEMLRDPLGRILDIGAGPGVLTPALLARTDRSCCTVDLSIEMLAAARRAAPSTPGRNHLAASDIEMLSFARSAFDTIVCVGVLQYLENIAPAMRELSRALRPGGQLVVTFPNREAPLNRIHAATVKGVRALHSAGGWLGLPAASPSRLTFRPDIPNRAFSVHEIGKAAADAQLACDSTVYHSLLFPFAVPGLAPVIGAWNRRVPSGVLSGNRQHWGREVIIRFIRS